jgi:hypothetical protein
MACLQRAGTVLLKPEWENLLDTGGAIKERRTAFPLRTKNRLQTKNDYLTGKAPYRFESVSLQRRVSCELDPIGTGRPTGTQPKT